MNTPRVGWWVAALVLAGCSAADLRVTDPARDGGALDAGALDAGLTDAGLLDAGPLDAGAADAGTLDAGTRDAGPVDAGALDAGPGDAGAQDAGTLDAGTLDAGTLDAGAGLDAGPLDAGAGVDAGFDAGQCVQVTAAPDVDPWLVRLPSAGLGGTVTQTTGTHQDVFLKSPSPLDYTRIGARLDWGGTIVFWGLSANPASNTIDANDTGRELQIALYDPQRNRQSCAYNATCLTSTMNCGNSITYLGWDPVQGGDECNRGASATWSVVGDALRLLVTPVQWNPDWDANDCRSTACAGAARAAQVQYVMELRYVQSLVVELSLEVRSLETIDHGLTSQEFPTLYVSHGTGGPDLPTLLDSQGTVIAIDQPANDGFTVKDFVSARPWVSFQNATRDYGVGLAMDQGIGGFQGWAGNGTTAPYFHNVRGSIAFALAHGATVRGRAYLALGGFSTIDGTLSALLAQRPAFGVVDAPVAGSLSHGPVTVAGWVLDTVHVSTVQVEVDGVVLANLPVSSPRPDVCALYPDYAGCPSVGYSGSVPLTSLDGCVHVMKVVATDADGNRTVLGERLVQR